MGWWRRRGWIHARNREDILACPQHHHIISPRAARRLLRAHWTHSSSLGGVCPARTPPSTATGTARPTPRRPRLDEASPARTLTGQSTAARVLVEAEDDQMYRHGNLSPVHSGRTALSRRRDCPLTLLQRSSQPVARLVAKRRQLSPDELPCLATQARFQFWTARDNECSTAKRLFTRPYKDTQCA